MAALSSMFLRPRALGVNPFAAQPERREDFMRTTGVYRVALVGGGGGGGGRSQNNVYYGDAGESATPVFDTVRVRDSAVITVGLGGNSGSQGQRGGSGGDTTVQGATAATASGGSGGTIGFNLDPDSSPDTFYRVISGGTRPLIDFNGWYGTVYTQGNGGWSGERGFDGQVFYNLIFRVA